MDHIRPARRMEEVEAASTKKAFLGTRALLLKGLLSATSSMRGNEIGLRARGLNPNGPFVGDRASPFFAFIYKTPRVTSAID